MAHVDVGSAQWFERARQRCVDHLRALLSIKIARESIEALIGNWSQTDHITNAALHTACVVAYCRPFTTAKTKHGNVFYLRSQIAKALGFDSELHTHILELRHKLIAHSDYALFPSTMYCQTIGDERLPVSLGLNVKGMFGIEALVLAERYARHLQICDVAIEKALNEACAELAKESARYPTEFESTHNLQEERSKQTATTSSELLPPPSGPAGRVSDPSFPDGLTGYRYMTLRHQIALIQSGKYLVQIEGVATEIEFVAES
jgi:hypothetical protein